MGLHSGHAAASTMCFRPPHHTVARMKPQAGIRGSDPGKERVILVRLATPDSRFASSGLRVAALKADGIFTLGSNTGFPTPMGLHSGHAAAPTMCFRPPHPVARMKPQARIRGGDPGKERVILVRPATPDSRFASSGLRVAALKADGIFTLGKARMAWSNAGCVCARSNFKSE
ncbi:hypothetical protein HNQ50_002822 [Silvimonas terrae]|uniref:Uncharacterized protein n=1 Tax=Silvimonas terrae TaxID=300266 RepID=A0A840RFH5_9NEIS|nr:hypothetical protein [Silvimonas terrae]